MSKSTNKLQIQQLLILMESNPDIARGFFKGSKEELVRFWQNAESELNSMGPPSKCIAEWKKVWADQKKYVRQKAAQNLQYKNGTGGGPNREQKFSSTEEGIYNLVGMKTSVEGVAAKTFGICSTREREVLVTPITDQCTLDDLISYEVEGTEEPQSNVSQDIPACSNVLQKPGTPISCSKRYKSDVKSPSDVLQAELGIQKELLDTIKVAVENSEESRQMTRRIYRSLEKMNDFNKAHYREMENLKRQEIDEMRRHNEFMEKMRARELEYKLEKNKIQLQLLGQQQ